MLYFCSYIQRNNDAKNEQIPFNIVCTKTICNGPGYREWRKKKRVLDNRAFKINLMENIM